MTRAKARVFVVVFLCLIPASAMKAAAVPVGFRELAQGLADRMEGFLKSGRNADGITPEKTLSSLLAEEIRLSIVPQALGYHERYLRTHSQADLKESLSRIDYLVRHLAEATRKRMYDGMAAYALVLAYRDSGKPEYLDAARTVLDEELEPRPRPESPNVQLMAAMGRAARYSLTHAKPDADALAGILDYVESKQNDDGSFEHAYGGTDLHYSAWMAMQLILIRGLVGSREFPQPDRILPRLLEFLKKRVDPKTGEPSYEETIDGQTRYYYAMKTASEPEYDTRGWSNELGYEVLSFDAFGLEDLAWASTRFLASIEKDGAFPGKWGYPVDPSSDLYEASRDPRSVIRTSVLFWSLEYALGHPGGA